MTTATNQAVPAADGERRIGSHLWGFAILAGLIVAGPAVAYPVFLMKVMCFALFAAGFNLLLGFGGLLSFGHAAYFGCGSYVGAYAAKTLGWSPEAAVAAGTGAAALLGLFFGAVAIRRQGIYFAMITLALAQLVYFVCLEAPITGGEDGLQSVPRGHLFGLVDLSNDRALYAAVGLVFFLAVLLVSRIVHSPFGHVLRAIRDNEPRAISLGYKTNRYRLAVFVLSTTLCGLAGEFGGDVGQGRRLQTREATEREERHVGDAGGR